MDDYEILLSSDVDDTLEVVTVSAENIEEVENKILYSAMQGFDANKKQYSAFTNETSSANELTIEDIDNLAENINSTLDNVLRANTIVRKKVITDELIGRTYESIVANINTDYKLNFPNPEGRNKRKVLDNARAIIDDFNNQINIRQFIRDTLAATYLEANRIVTLRVDGGNYVIDDLPLGLAYVSDYSVNGEPIIAVDVKELESRLRKTYSKNKKRKAIFFDNIREDIKNNYPKEISDAYAAGETIARLDTKYTKIIRYNNLGRKYGVSPIFRCLKSSVVLDNLMKTDVANSKIRQRKILLQILRKELIAQGSGKKNGISEAIYAHKQAVQALATSTCLYTAAPFVEDMRYVEPKTEDTSDNKIEQYTAKLISGLGIEFTSSNTGTVTVAKISLDQIMRIINAIGEQIGTVIKKFYEVVLENSGIDVAYAPDIKIIDSEQLEAGVRMDLAKFLYSTLGSSAQTAFEMVGIDYQDELTKRTAENADGIDDVFMPHKTSYTVGGDDAAGRPADTDSNDPNKQAKDQVNNNV